MPKILVLFHSRTGNTAALAEAIADGARGVRFTEVDIRRLEDVAAEKLADGIPAWREGREELARKYRTLESAELRGVLDELGPLASRGGLVDKVGAAFTTALASRGGHEATLAGMITALASLGMLICPPGQGEGAKGAGSPLGAIALTGEGGGIGEAELAIARALGKRVAKVAEWVRHAKGHESGHLHSHGHSHHHH